MEKPYEVGPELVQNPAMNEKTNAGRHIDGEYEFESMRPSALVLVGSSVTDKIGCYMALWDTGSTRTCISKRIAKELGLKPKSKFKKHKEYEASIRLASDFSFSDIELLEYKMPPGIDVIIGMDIISKGELVFIPDPENRIGYFRFVTK